VGLSKTASDSFWDTPSLKKEVKDVTETSVNSTGRYSREYLDGLNYSKADIENKKTWKQIEDELKHRLVLNLFAIGAVLIDDTKPYNLRGGTQTGFYINLRETSSFRPEGRKVLGNNTQRNAVSRDMVDLLYGKIVHEIGSETYDLVTFVPHGAMNIAFGLHHKYDISVGYAIKEDKPKGYGVPKHVHGELYDGYRVLVVDDVMTSGDSIKDCVEKIGKQCKPNKKHNKKGIKDVTVNYALLVADRLQGGEENLRQYKTPMSPEGIETSYVVSSAEIVNILHGYGMITDRQLDTVLGEINI